MISKMKSKVYKIELDLIRSKVFLSFERRYLFDKIVKHEPSVILEIGTGAGGSTKVITEAIISNEKGVLYTCDTNKDRVELVKRDIDNENVRFHVMTSHDLIKRLKRDKIIPDFLFFDGPSNPEIALDDFKSIENYVDPGCVFMSHDWDYNVERIGGSKSKKNSLLKPYLRKNKSWKILEELSGEPGKYPNISKDGSYIIENSFGMVYAIKR